jgi:hypothetical protein
MHKTTSDQLGFRLVDTSGYLLEHRHATSALHGSLHENEFSRFRCSTAARSSHRAIRSRRAVSSPADAADCQRENRRARLVKGDSQRGSAGRTGSGRPLPALIASRRAGHESHEVRTAALAGNASAAVGSPRITVLARSCAVTRRYSAMSSAVCAKEPPLELLSRWA